MKYLCTTIALCFSFALITFSQNPEMNGKWKMVKDKSSFLDYYQQLTLEVTVNNNETVIITRMGPKKKYEEKLTFTTDGMINHCEIKDGTFSTNIHMGIRLPVGSKKEVIAHWEGDQSLNVVEKYEYYASQGKKRGEMSYHYQYSTDQNLLICTITRPTRPKDQDIKFVFERFEVRNINDNKKPSNSKNTVNNNTNNKTGNDTDNITNTNSNTKNSAYLFKMADDWDIHSALPEQACWISLQGVVNEKKPQLYFTFGPDYPFNYTEDLAGYLETDKNFSFTKLTTLEEGLKIFKKQIKGYIIWDKKVRTSLIVAYTLAGLEKGIVITEELLPLVKQAKLKEIADFRGKFEGKNDSEIYSWAKDHYWGRCSRDVIVWLGGVHGTALMPACADYGMMKKGFFTDLSVRPTDTLECGLTKALFAEMNPLGQVWGWHSYKKDLEEQMTTLLSSYALNSDGLNSQPNTSFLIHIPVSPGFTFRNNHNIVPGKEYIPEKKIYLALIQSDGIGIGAWFKPGRGSIPYAWEVTMQLFNKSPVLLEYYYKQATPNDYFIGGLSGSAYMYPRVFPEKWLPEELKRAAALMKNLDLDVFQIMDYSEGGTETSDNNLPKDLVDEYYRSMPDAIGFVNGYRAANTFTVRDKRPLISYDYYLAAEKPEEEVVADLEELAAINAERPYFLLVHVRESSDIARVKSICNKLSGSIEVIPLDIFLKMAGETPTFKEYYYQAK